MLLAMVAGCQTDVGAIDGAFYDGDGRSVHCAVNLDAVAQNSFASIETALDRAALRGETAELYAHDPGRTVTLEKLEYVLAGARDRGLAFVTYAEFAASGGTGPGLALSFDDTSIESWAALQPMFQLYGARVTFFVSRYARLTAEQRELLRGLVAAGHDVQAHSVQHLRAPDYVETYGLAAYLHDEVLPSIEVMRADGFPITAYAYPFGARTAELDEAILEHVPILRSVSFSWSALVSSPCPR